MECLKLFSLDRSSIARDTDITNKSRQEFRLGFPRWNNMITRGHRPDYVYEQRDSKILKQAT